jgi:tetratricopeptide (TPR) repeat protein
MTHAGSLLRACAIAVAVSTCAPATALAASAQDSAVAQSLYDQARTLAAAGNWADACGKFEESQRLDPTPVTEYHLADCYEHAGRTASAWTTFLDLATTARAAKRADREKAATDRATALEPKLTRLVVDVPPGAQVPDLVVRRDGEAVGRGQWGTPVPVDPGKHLLGRARRLRGRPDGHHRGRRARRRAGRDRPCPGHSGRH